MRLSEISPADPRWKQHVEESWKEIAHLIKKYFYLQQETDQLKVNAKKEAMANHFLAMTFVPIRDSGYHVGHESANQFMERVPRTMWYEYLRTHRYVTSTYVSKRDADRLVELNKHKQMTDIEIEHLLRSINFPIPL